MAFTDLTVDNGWIPVQYESDVLLKEVTTSAVESVARKVNMKTDQVKVPRFIDSGVNVVAEGATIPLNDPDLDSVILDAHKFANRFATSSEDDEDSIVNFLDTAKKNWLSNYAVALDNAVLGVTGTGGPYESVYRAVGSGNRTATAGALTYDHLVEAIGEMETARKGGLVVIAHPSLKMALRSLKDADGNFVIDPDTRLGEATPTLFGHQVAWSYGAKTNATYSDNPSGNALLVVAAKDELILGVRSGPESKVSTEEQWANDNIELKLRARRAFVLAEANSARVVEITAGA